MFPSSAAVLAAMTLAVVRAGEGSNGVCPKCDRSLCPPYDPRDCAAGVVADACGCCYICALQEGEACNIDGVATAAFSTAKCGDNLECRIRADVTTTKETTCVCKTQKEVCGSDGVTYANMCQLWAANSRVGSKDDKIILQKQGRCPQKPHIRTPPASLEVKVGDKVTLACEAAGNPIPYVSWTSRDSDGAVVVLPSDDARVSVNVRGGPERYQVTGFLQIIEVAKEHESDYTCHAVSDLGDDSATARLKVRGESHAL